jgi:ABC-type microcin C transport system duplicated ATPase subunit YejF
VTKESLKNTILQQLQALHREFYIPMLFVTQNAVEAIATCEEVSLLQAGRILGEATRQNFSAESSQFARCSGRTSSPAKWNPVKLRPALMRGRAWPRSRPRSWCWIGADHFKLRHHPVVLVLQHVAMEHEHARMVGEL